MRLAIFCSLLLLPAATAAQPLDSSRLCSTAIARAEAERGIPPRLLLAIGQVESGRRDPATGSRQPWPWTVNAEGRGSFYPDKAAAIAAVQALLARGVRSIDVGCLQVNLRHHPNAFAGLDEAFDPLANARYAAGFLAELQSGRGDWMRAAAHYHSQTPTLAERYQARVAAAWEQERAAPATPMLAALAPSPGGARLDNGADRAALVPAPAGAGRGLDAYRAAPIPLAGRTPPMPRRS